MAFNAADDKPDYGDEPIQFITWLYKNPNYERDLAQLRIHNGVAIKGIRQSILRQDCPIAVVSYLDGDISGDRPYIKLFKEDATEGALVKRVTELLADDVCHPDGQENFRDFKIEGFMAVLKAFQDCPRLDRQSDAKRPSPYEKLKKILADRTVR